MFKNLISEQYRSIVTIMEIALFLLLIPLLYNFVPLNKKAATVVYIEGKTVDSVAQSLEKNGYTVTLADKLIMQTQTLPKSGWYRLKHTKSGRFSFFRHIGSDAAKSMNIVIFSAETYVELLNRLANDMKLDRKKLYTQYKKLSRFKDADIFAGHYIVARKADEKTVMRYLFEQSRTILDLFIEKNFRKRPDHFEIKVLLTIASIIQKESNSIDEMPMISAVIYNRVRKNMKLQMDSTLNYGPYSHQIVTSERIKSDTSPYNTYKYKGLPPYPLGTISINALHAAMFPAKNKNLFFMLKPDGTHQFCETYEKHLDNIHIFRAYQKKRDEEKKLAEEETKEKEKEKKIVTQCMSTVQTNKED